MARIARLDPLGGIAGDMFVAAMVDAFPALEAVALGVAVNMRDLACIEVRFLPFHDGILGGRRLELSVSGKVHAHRSWRWIRDWIAASQLDDTVKRRATAIFARLAACEAQVHAVDVDDVHFHEVGALDSIFDIIAAAALIEASGIAAWYSAPLPLGSGSVATAHGRMSVPTPATLRLIEGFSCHDDGIAGERVTPTGAAILAELVGQSGQHQAVSGRIAATGSGFGMRKLAGCSNCLRIIVVEQEEGLVQGGEVVEIEFEVDDATPEQLAGSLEHLRESTGVIDVVQMAVVGKKGRMAHSIRVLAEPLFAESVALACFDQTPTLGLRLACRERRTLRRQLRTRSDGRRVKRVKRPSGEITEKAEWDDISSLETHAVRIAASASDKS